MERRDFVKTGLAGAAVGLAASSLALADNHAHNHGGKSKPAAPRSKELDAVAETAHECVLHANACVAECNKVLATGDPGMADCQQAVLAMVSVCEATAANATFNLVDAKMLHGLFEVCKEFCDYCAEACKPHAEHYEECRVCMESCEECSEACEAYLKA